MLPPSAPATNRRGSSILQCWSFFAVGQRELGIAAHLRRMGCCLRGPTVVLRFCACLISVQF
jgi:hypothetical protein